MFHLQEGLHGRKTKRNDLSTYLSSGHSPHAGASSICVLSHQRLKDRDTSESATSGIMKKSNLVVEHEELPGVAASECLIQYSLPAYDGRKPVVEGRQMDVLYR